MSRRRPITRVVHRKTKIAVIYRGRVICSDTRSENIEAFLCGFDPELAARRARASSGEAEKAIQRLLARAD